MRVRVDCLWCQAAPGVQKPNGAHLCELSCRQRAQVCCSRLYNLGLAVNNGQHSNRVIAAHQEALAIFPDTGDLARAVPASGAGSWMAVPYRSPVSREIA